VLGSYEKRRLVQAWASGIAGSLFLVCGIRWYQGVQNPVVEIPNPTPPALNAFTGYVAAGKRVHADEKALNRLMEASDKEFSLPEAKQLLAKHRGTLDLVRLQFPRQCQMPPLRSFHDTIPYAADFRTLARLFRLEGRIHEAEGNVDYAARSYADCIFFGSHIPQGGVVIHALVGSAVETIGQRPLWKITPKLSLPAAKSVIATLERTEAQRESLACIFTEEKYVMQAGVMEIFNGDTSVDDLMGTEGDPLLSLLRSRKNSPIYAIWSKKQIMTNVTETMDNLIVTLQKPYYLKSLSAFEQNSKALSKDPISAVLFPVFSGVGFRYEQTRTQNQLLLANLALHVYRQERGRYPESLTELVQTGYLTHLPVDGFVNNAPLHYCGEKQRYHLYSLGPDGVDDNGAAIDNKKRQPPMNSRPFHESTRYLVDPSSVGDIVAGVNF